MDRRIGRSGTRRVRSRLAAAGSKSMLEYLKQIAYKSSQPWTGRTSTAYAPVDEKSVASRMPTMMNMRDGEIRT